MNRPIVRLYALVVLLFALLVAFTSRWTVFEAASLRDNPLNKRAQLEQQRIADREHALRGQCREIAGVRIAGARHMQRVGTHLV